MEGRESERKLRDDSLPFALWVCECVPVRASVCVCVSVVCLRVSMMISVVLQIAENYRGSNF